MSKKHCSKDRIHSVYHLSVKQKELTRLILDANSKLIFVEGPSGTSKTFLAVYAALKLFYDNKIDGIRYIRSVEESGRKSFGILPGELEEKFAPYMIPLQDKLEELLPPTEVKQLFENGLVDCMPLNFCRGQNWSNKLIIFDEAQNADFGEITTVITRLAEGSTMVICGDTMQSDVKNSGFRNMINLFSDDTSESNGIHSFKFGKGDIVRSEILKFIIDRIEYGKEAAITDTAGSGLDLYPERRFDWGS
jgi:phosphate starvation-inducible PhoH-like protein